MTILERPSTHGNKLAALGACVLLSLAATPARADAPVESDAETLFVQAKALMVQGNDVLACPKLQESQRLDPGTGTLLLLALCHERIGKSASAWTEYREALVSSQREKRADREELARRHIASLEPHLMRARLRVADGNATLPRFEIRRDGETMPPTAWSVPTPLDPGTHIFQAFASGEERWSQSLIVSEPGEQEIFVPALHATVLPPPPVPAQTLHMREEAPPTRTETSRNGSALRVLGFSAATLAVAGAAVGAIFGVRAIGKSHDAQHLCPSYPCNPAAQDANDAARAAAEISNIAFAVGGAGVVGAFTFFILDSGSAAPATSDRGQSANGTRHEARERVFTVGWQGQW